ncbi:MAG: acyltransferase family protein [Pseudonocardiales bacterium]|nr:acyltransferase family protein [Pseudonocardiales bacterium]
MGIQVGRRGFRPDIEGLRAIAVLAVVLYHATVPGLAGGFVGVDVFFVVSGFLITGLLWREVVSTGTVRLARFYSSRARRLLPAAATVLVAVVVTSAWLLPALRARNVLVDVLASAVYAGNYRFALQGMDYLAADAPPSPAQHYWSLGVEEQFYLLWPALLLAAGWIGHRASGAYQRPGTGRLAFAGPAVIPAVLTLTSVTVLSFAVALQWTRVAPPWAFFSLPSRAWELAIGGLVALSAPVWCRLPSLLAAALGWVGLALILASCVWLGSSTPYPGFAALAPVLGTALVIATGSAQPRGGVGSALSLPPLQHVGRYSYSWYLWHWPVLVLAPVILGHALGLGAALVAVAMSAGLAVLTTHSVEDPIRFATFLRRSPAASLVVGGGATVMGVAASLLFLLVVPVPVGSGPPVRAPRLSVATPPSTAAPDSGGQTVLSPAAPQSPVQALTAQVQSAVAASADTQEVPANLTPSLADAAADQSVPFRDDCLLDWAAVHQGACAYAAKASPTTVALIGDSHAAQWFPALDQIARQQQWRLETLTKKLCPLLLDLPIHSPQLGREYTECEAWRTEILDRIQAERPALVILDMTRRYGEDFSFTTYGSRWLDSLTLTVADIRATGAAVLVLGPIPDPLTSVPTCLSTHLDAASDCAPDRSKAINDAGITAEQAATAAGGGHYADLTDLFCTATQCPVVVGNTLVYRDDNHVTTSYAQWLAPVFYAEISSVMAGSFTDQTSSTHPG